jgi:hypothetical protein
MLRGMTVVQKIDRRQAQRFKGAFKARFSINNGPEQISDTMNFTSRSLAIRSDCEARKGDRVSVRFAGLPVIEGEIVRVFPEGFALTLSERSLALMSHTDPLDLASGAPLRSTAADNITSPFLAVRAPFPARALITSGLGYTPGYNRHFLSIVTADPGAIARARNIWITAEATRWIAAGLRFERRKNRGIAVMVLNDWQLHMGAAYGLGLTIVGEEMMESKIDIDADQIGLHLDDLEPELLAVSA